MKIVDWVFAVEFGFLFGSLVLFCWWQVRKMDQLDAEEAEKERLAAKKEKAGD